MNAKMPALLVTLAHTMELLCPAGSLPALQAAVDHGADAIYIGFKDETNARHFAGLNFNDLKLKKAISYVHQHRRKLHIAINTFAHPGNSERWKQAVDKGVDLGADALIIADLAVLDYAAKRYPDQELHLSVQASATNSAAIAFYQQEFNVKRVVLPRVLTIEQIRQLKRHTEVDLEVFAFGSLCIMAEGRCYLSSYVTGESPNTVGACSPAKFVRWQETPQGLETRLNEILLDRCPQGEQAGYPTLCKGRYFVDDTLTHSLEKPVSLNTLELIPALAQIGICSVKIEGRQRSPAYVETVTRIWRQALDSYQTRGENYYVEPHWQRELETLAEGNHTTLGAYQRQWQ